MSNPVRKVSDAQEKVSDESTLLLMGMTGAGKSTIGNFLIQKDVFGSRHGILSVSHGPQMAKTEKYGTSLSVVDTPGLNDAWEGQNTEKNSFRYYGRY